MSARMRSQSSTAVLDSVPVKNIGKGQAQGQGQGLGSGFVALLPALAMGLLLGLGCWLALTVNGYYVFVLANVALLALTGIGLNVLLGLTGQMSFGHVGFYAIGAYTVAILTGAGWSFWLAWPLAALLAAASGTLLALPALRVGGPYLAMVTIAFGFIVEHGIVEMRGLTGGQNGIMGITGPALGEFASGERAVALLAIAATAVALVAFHWLARGTWGAAMRAVRDTEVASASTGLNPLVIKTAAFAISALCAGAAGALFAPLAGFVTPHTFGFMQSILFVLVVMLGGAGSVAGPVLGAIVVGLLPEVLSGLEEYRLLFFGGLLLVVLWAAPQGMAGIGQYLFARRGLASADTTGMAPATLPLRKRKRQFLQANALTMRFGGVTAVNELSLRAEPGRVNSLIGPNGAGKTTVFNMLSGFYRPTAGSFALGEHTFEGGQAMRIARAGVARTYQTSQLFDSLSVADNVALAAQGGRLGWLFGRAPLAAPHTVQRTRDLLRYCGYTGSLSTPAAALAHVDRRLVEIARALASDPDVLLLDEPAAGLSHQDKIQLAGLLRSIADAGVTVLLVEHDMTLVMSISDQVIVLDAGQLLAVGAPAAIQANPAVRKAYLGEQSARVSITERTTTPAAASTAVPAAAPPMLDVQQLVAGYGAEPVLHKIDLHINRHEAVALLGANGAGKSTLLRSLIGLHQPGAGQVLLNGRSITGAPAERVTAHGMVLVPEGRQVFGELTVRENLQLGAFLTPAQTTDRVDEMFARFPRLAERQHRQAGLLSGGEQQMLAIGRALMSQPGILLLDEPSLGLAPKIIDDLFDALDALRRDGMTLLVVDQMATLALAIADRAYVIDEGRIAAHGTADEIAANEALSQMYLGVGVADPQ